ncbi:DUF2750 domain-containing protein [Acinetobacter sp. 194]|uniref:DUF2750 domain-containing protein n=1 Tax=Acinetobacter shaoyimingii TaxID=2715164 RepID=UPI00140955B9|nr:DUF2750 domain-containing protein [Acinetobacter shaoyimingii]NHB57630.1 DUF2750 domain-containing protein [Acinetobacter shaoyimingii]
MRNPYQRQASHSYSMGNLTAKEQYNQFIAAIVAQGKVYGLYHDGWALCSTPSGLQTLAIWQSKGLAQLLIKDKWVNHEIQEVALIPFIEKVIPYIRKHNTRLSLNLTPEGQNILVSGRQFLIDLKAHLYKLYLADPELFKSEQLPLPRRIRLHDRN